MSDTHPNNKFKNLEVSYEPKDINVRSVAIFGVGLLMLIVAAMGLIWWLLTSLDNRTAAQQGNQPPAIVAPPEPRLQPNPIDQTTSAEEQLKALRAKEEMMLNTYGWVDKEAGIARIPIGRAMELVVTKNR
ncbi:MAG: hypothetical protein JXM69_04920 [Anaerolineae bacterium]|nr:hypothetical protein [Anaerolineae bacterium]